MKESWKEKFDKIKDSQRKLITTKVITQKLSARYKADYTCPLTTGIFVGIIANNSEEELASGKKRITPYWRVIKPRGLLYDKYLGKILPQKNRLQHEGFQFEKIKGNAEKVKDFEKYLVK